MFLLFAALASQNPPWWRDFRLAYNRCGIVMNVDAYPAGDGVLIEKDYRGLILDSSRARPRKPIQCIASWAKRRGLKVPYRDLTGER
jgi:hypothetical protein